MRNEYLEILGLSPGATEQDIKTAYRKLAKKYHPDITKDSWTKNEFIKVTEAYKFLTDVGPRPNHEHIDFNYDPQKDEYEEWRKKARTYARKKAEEETLYQQSLLNRLYKYFNIAAAIIIAFNIFLIIDYFLPSETHQWEIVAATEIYFTDRTGNSEHLYDQLIFKNFKLKFQKQELKHLSASTATLYTTPVFNTLKEVKVKTEEAFKTLIPINRLYRILIFIIPAVFFFGIVYFYLAKWHYNKPTFAIVISILFLVQIFLIFRYSI